VVRVNGEYLDVKGKSVLALLDSLGYDLKRVAVELNGNIVPRSQYEKTVLSDCDTVEVVSFVGGG